MVLHEPIIHSFYWSIHFTPIPHLFIYSFINGQLGCKSWLFYYLISTLIRERPGGRDCSPGSITRIFIVRGTTRVPEPQVWFQFWFTLGGKWTYSLSDCGDGLVCTHISKIIKLYNLNRCHLLCVNYTKIMLLEKKRKNPQFQYLKTMWS